MNVFVVNLARRSDRRARMQRLLPKTWNVDYTTDWPGPLDGAHLEPGDLDGVGLFPWEIASANEWWNRPLKLGEIGCAMSHLACWKRAAELGSELTVVLEDDIEFSADPDISLTAAVGHLEVWAPGWDLAYLGRWALHPESGTPVAPLLVRPGYSYCTFAYMLSARGLERMLSVDFEHALIPVDELLPALYMHHPRADVRRRYPPRVSAYAFEPPLVTQLPKDLAGSDTEETPFFETATSEAKASVS
jgi:glycosyl transferase, family 25